MGRSFEVIDKGIWTEDVDESIEAVEAWQCLLGLGVWQQYMTCFWSEWEIVETGVVIYDRVTIPVVSRCV